MHALSFSPKLAFKLLKQSVSEWSKDNAMRLAASLSYYSVFSIAPLLIIAIGIVGLVFKEEAANGMIAAQLQQLLGPKAAESVQTIVASASQSGAGATGIGFIFLVVGASGVFGELKAALNTIWGVEQKPGLGIMGFIRERIASFGMVLGIGFLLLISLMLATVLNATSGVLERSLHLPKIVSSILGMVLGFGVETMLFATLFKMLPDAKVKWRNVWVGAVVTAVLFEGGKMGLAWYLAQKSTTSPFGAAGSLVVLLLWVFYASCILFFGAEFTKVYSAETGARIQPSKVAQKVPGTNLAAGGSTAPEIESEPHPLSPNAPVPAVPMKESLTPLLMGPDVESRALRDLRVAQPRRLQRLEPRSKLEEWIATAHEHPVAELGAALGVGLLIGTLSRTIDKKAPTLTAAEHFEQGSRKTAAATTSIVVAGASWLARHLTKKALRQYGATAQKEGSRWTHELAVRVEKALK